MNDELTIPAPWKVELVDGTIKLYNYLELLGSYSAGKTYNCTVMDDLCEICASDGVATSKLKFSITSCSLGT